MNKLLLKKMLKEFFIEDIGDMDITSNGIFPPGQKGSANFIVKSAGIIAGLPIIQEGYQLLDPSIEVNFLINEGDHVQKGQIIADVSGPVATILTGERVILNLLQRMSGIATMTNLAIKTLNDPSIHICDTRKTTPGLRMLEKYAVTLGGGKNHRKGLYDGVMIKDNHISFSGSITKAVERVRKKVGHMVNIEVETESLDQVKEAVEAGADIIMFDNRSPDEIRQLIKHVPPHIITEASGGITLESIGNFAHTGVDYISLGFLTHSVKALDISVNVEIR